MDKTIERKEVITMMNKYQYEQCNEIIKNAVFKASYVQLPMLFIFTLLAAQREMIIALGNVFGYMVDEKNAEAFLKDINKDIHFDYDGIHNFKSVACGFFSENTCKRMYEYGWEIANKLAKNKR